MEPALQDLLLDCPHDVKLWLQNLGIQTCMDVRHMWRSGGAMVEEYEAGEKMAAEQAFTLAMVWTMAAKRAATSRDHTVAAMVQERESVNPQRPVVRLESAPSSSSRVPARSMVITGLASATAPTALSHAKDPHVKEVAVKDIKVQALFQLAMEHLLDLASLGTSVEALRDPLRLQAFKDSVMVGTQRLGSERIGALTSALRRWRKYAIEKGYPVRNPSPLQLSEFLRGVASGGPTAAASMYQALKWFQQNLGVPFQVEHFLLAPYRFHEVTHTGKQAKELEPWEMLNLILMARKATGTRLLVLCFFLQSAISCIRFEHAQRSTMQEEGSHALRFTCSQGKSRRQGARPAYDWVTTEVSWQGFSLLATLKDFFKNESLSTSSFLWPALLLDACDLWQIHDATVVLVDKKMSRSRYLEIWRGTLMEMGLDRTSAVTAGYNRLRRFMPTLAGCLQASRDDLQAVGSWIEIPAGGGPEPRPRNEKASVSMGFHYSGQKAQRSAEVKLKFWQRFMVLAKIKMSELALNQHGLLVPNSWSWVEFCQAHRMTPEEEQPQMPVAFTKDVQEVLGEDDKAPPSPATSSLSSPRQVADGDVGPGCPPSHGDALPVAGESAVTATLEEKIDPEDSDVSSSASDVSASGSELEGVLPLLQSRRQFWPTLTTRHASLVPVGAEALQRERRQMQAKHLWYNVDIRWSDLKDKLEVLAPTGLTREDIWRHLFLTKQRKNPYEEGCYTGEDVEDVKQKWEAKKHYFEQYKKDGPRPPCIELDTAIQGFNIDNTAAYQAIEDSKALHARRWQTKEGMYRIKRRALPDVRDAPLQDDNAAASCSDGKPRWRSWDGDYAMGYPRHP